MTSTSSGSGNADERISNLITFAREHREVRPLDALSALMEAVALDAGPDAARDATARVRDRLGGGLCDLVDAKARTRRAEAVVDELLRDESTLLFQRGKSHLLRQAMEDGSSVVCRRCGAMIKADRWRQHKDFWCEANADKGSDS